MEAAQILTVPTSDCWSRREDSLPLPKGDLLIDTPELCRLTSYLYSAYRFALTHHGARASIESAPAHRSTQATCSSFLPLMSVEKKPSLHLRLAKQDIPSSTTTTTFFHPGTICCWQSVLFLETRQQWMTITLSARPHAAAIPSVGSQNKGDITSIHQAHL